MDSKQNPCHHLRSHHHPPSNNWTTNIRMKQQPTHPACYLTFSCSMHTLNCVKLTNSFLVKLQFSNNHSRLVQESLLNNIFSTLLPLHYAIKYPNTFLMLPSLQHLFICYMSRKQSHHKFFKNLLTLSGRALPKMKPKHMNLPPKCREY